VYPKRHSLRHDGAADQRQLTPRCSRFAALVVRNATDANRWHGPGLRNPGFLLGWPAVRGKSFLGRGQHGIRMDGFLFRRPISREDKPSPGAFQVNMYACCGVNQEAERPPPAFCFACSLADTLAAFGLKV